MKHRGIAVGAAVAVIAYAIFVWPTIYRYDHMNLRGTVLPVRVHRITGRTEILYRSGWELAEQSTPNVLEVRSIPAGEITKIQGTAEVWLGQLKCNLYNGSNWRIREVVVHLRVFDPNSQAPKLERYYRLANEYFTEPLETGIFDASVGFDLETGQRIAWHIKSAKGDPQ
jgi:hypothetical protein